MSTRERLRASDRDREQAVEVLHDAATEGRLSADELDERLALAFAATTYGELDRLVDDLPAPLPPAPPPLRSRPVRAGWWPRFGAMLIDVILVSLIAEVLRAALHARVGSELTVLVSVAYFTFFEGRLGAGMGKRALGLRVVDQRTGGPIGYPRAFVRWIGRILSAIVFFIGYFWMLGDSERQCWHDKLAGDVVVYADGRRELEPPRRLV
jgi:uncharacterized RDD family membrane protein YckC